MINLRSAAQRKIVWMRDLSATTMAANGLADDETIRSLDEIEEETKEGYDDLNCEAEPLTYDQFEQQCYDELMRIHRQALERPMTDRDYTRAKAIVKEWKQKKTERE